MIYVQGVYELLNSLEQGCSMYSASGTIEPVVTSLHTNVHSLSSSLAQVREAWRGFFCSLRSLWGSFGGVGGLGRHGQWLGNVLGKLGCLGRVGECLGILWVGSGMVGEVWRRFGECMGDAFERHVEVWVFVP